MSAEEFLATLEGMGVFEGREEDLDRLRVLADQGIHPAEALGLWRRVPQEEAMEAVLDSFDIEGVARYVKKNGCQRVVVLCGAGISTSAGIPDFRTPGSGLYDNLQEYNLSRPELIFDLDYFRMQPAPFYKLCESIWPGNFAPTPAHHFLRLLHEKGVLLRCYTQNIDSLECLAGLPKEKLVAAHGNFDGAHVIDTYPLEEVDIGEVKAAIDQGEEGWQALRKKYGNLVKPQIIFFGEQLPDRFYSLAPSDLKSCDLLIVMGTSLVVQPFAGLVSQANSSAPRLLINREPAGTCENLELGFRFQLNETENWRDAWFPGSCDEGCRALAAALGWEEDLDKLISAAAAQPPKP